jgi:hypothetical protein
MIAFAEIAKIGTLSVLVPLAAFSANWVHRSQKGYAQTSAADFLIAVFIFDSTVVLASGDFEPFIRAPELRPLITYWHFVIAFISGLFWVGIIRWGEPALAAYYQHKRPRNPPSFPILSFLICWMAVLVLVTLHVAFFVITRGGTHG